MSFRITNSSRPVIQSEENQVSETKKKSLADVASSSLESAPAATKNVDSKNAAQIKAELSLTGLARQIGLFNYVLPQDTTAQKLNPGSIPTTLATGEEENDKPSGMTTLEVGEEGGGFQPRPETEPKLPSDPGSMTTMATGEEGGDMPSGMTTLEVGEEGEGFQPRTETEPTLPSDPGSMTTMATGEEGDDGLRPELPGRMTTLAVGEDGGFEPAKPGGFTTLMTGEEGDAT